MTTKQGMKSKFVNYCHFLTHNCGLLGLTVLFAFVLTPIKSGYADTQIIAAGTIANNPLGTEDNTLIINGTANAAEISGGSHTVNGGGKTNNASVSDGTLTVKSLGTANDTFVYDNGNLTIEKGGKANDSIITDGTMNLFGKADGTMVSDNGKLIVEDGGKDENSMIFTDGTLEVKSGGTSNYSEVEGIIEVKGTANNTSVSGGLMTVSDGGVANDATISADGTLTVDNEGAANYSQIQDKASMEVLSGGTANHTTVLSGGEFSAEANSTVDDLTINSGAKYTIYTSADISNATIHGQDFSLHDKKLADWTVKEGGNILVDAESVTEKLILEGGNLNVLEGGTANDSIVNANGTLTVEKDGVANATIVNSDGSLSVEDGGTANDTIVNEDGIAMVAAGGKAERTTVNGGGYLLVDNGGVADNSVIKELGTLETNGEINNTIIETDGLLTIAAGGLADNSKLLGGEISVENNGLATNTSVKNGTMTIGNGGIAEKSTLYGGTLDVEANSMAASTTVKSGGKMQVATDGMALDTIVESGGELTAKNNARLENLLAHGGAILDLESGTVLTGDISIDKNADTSKSSFDFSKIFAAISADIKSLTVTGGVNEAFTDKLVNEDTTTDKSLTLDGGEYSLANVIMTGSTQVAGWDIINIKGDQTAPATLVKLETDIELSGSNQNLIIGSGSVLDVSGHSPLNITITGNVTNSGIMDFTIMDNFGEADDSVTITGNYTAAPGAMIVFNVEPENGKADKLIVNGDVIGDTSLYLKTSSDKDAAGDILFAEVPGDDASTPSSFSVWRVEGSPYNWETKFADNKWYTYTNGLAGGVAPEMIAYMGLYDAGFEQTRSLAKSIRDNSGANGCSLCYTPLHTAWIAPIYSHAKVEAPFDYKADISGLDAGIDIAANGVNKLGIMASYRKGNYDFSGKGNKFHSDTGSEIDIESYLTGLYFRHDHNRFTFMTAVYGGIQKADIKSDDGVRADSNALELGAMVDMAYTCKLGNGISLIPEAQISYTMLDYGKIKDNAGKDYNLKTAHRIETEAGAKLQKSWELDEGTAAIYVKPSVIQTLNSGGKFAIADDVTVLKNQTLGRLEIGAEADINQSWAVGVSAAHTFNNNYQDTSFNLDLKYRW